MLLDKDEYLEIFIEHFIEFIEDVGILYQYVCDNFREQIANNDYEFFTDHADWDKVITHKNKDLIMPKLMELRESVRNLDINNKLKALKYVENLIKLCDLYNS